MFGVYLNMKVSSQNNTINFTSTPLHKVNLINAIDGSFIPAVFSRLNPNNPLDTKAIAQIKKDWAQKSILIDAFYSDFIHSNNIEKYHAIELVNNDSLEKRIVGLTASQQKDSEYILKLLIVKPEFCKKNPKRQIKNIGEILLGEMFYQAEKSKANSLNFLSTNPKFYNTIFSSSLKDSYVPHKTNIIPMIKPLSFLRFTKEEIERHVNYWKKKFGITI